MPAPEYCPLPDSRPAERRAYASDGFAPENGPVDADADAHSLLDAAFPEADLYLREGV